MASTFTDTIVAYFASETEAENAVLAVKSAGFSSSQIGVALSDVGAGTNDQSTAVQASHPAHSTGAKTASAWQRFKSFFEGSDVEPYADEKATDDRSHEITASNGYEYDDFSNSLSGLNVPEDRSRYFGHRIGSQAGAVVTVSAAGREDEAAAILERNGGDLGSDVDDYDYSRPIAADQQKIQLLGEVLRVQVERVSRGEVRIRKEVITEQQTVQVPVTREELVIERISVSGARTAAGEIGADSEIRIPLTEEKAGVGKETVVREEVIIGKRAIENVQEVGGEVRHEELNVDDSTLEGRVAHTPTSR